MSARVALVTGCGRDDGIGAAIARRLAADGLAVVLTDVEPHGRANAGEDRSGGGPGPGLEGVVEQICRDGGVASAAFGDVSAPGVAEELVEATIGRHGRLDVLVNNAAAPQGDDRRPVHDVPDAAFRHLVDVNLYGTFQMTRAAVVPLRDAGQGRIVNISSIMGRRGHPLTAVYAMTKAGVIGLTQATAIELAPHGITVNAVCPGFVRTSRVESGKRRRGVNADADYLAAIGGVPAGRIGSPTEVASTVAHLASVEAGYVTAQTVTVDGGKLGF